MVLQRMDYSSCQAPWCPAALALQQSHLCPQQIHHYHLLVADLHCTCIGSSQTPLHAQLLHLLVVCAFFMQLHEWAEVCINVRCVRQGAADMKGTR